MPILECYVDDDTLAGLKQVAKDTGRTVEELAEAAIAEAVNNTKRGGR